MPKERLTKNEIIELSALLKEVFAYLNELKQRNQLASRIQYPKIPPIFSESMIMHLINDRKILNELQTISKVEFGGKQGDVLVSSGQEQLRIEVKATAKSAFEYFGEKDITADYLIWVHFGDYFVGNSDKLIEINVINRPSKYFKKPVKITLSKLKEVVGKELKVMQINLEEFSQP